MYLAGVSNLYGAKARCRSFLLRRAFAFPPRPDRAPAEIHHANRYLAIASALGAPAWDGALPEFRLTPEADELPAQITALCAHPKLLTIASGAAYGRGETVAGRVFPGSGRALDRTGGNRRWCSVRSSERAIGDEVIAGLDARKAYNLSGRTSLIELMHLLKKFGALRGERFGNHASCRRTGTPRRRGYSDRSDYTATGPIGANWHLLYEKLECSPCFRRECPSGDQKCIRAITPAMAIAELDAIVAERTCRVRKTRGAVAPTAGGSSGSARVHAVLFQWRQRGGCGDGFHPLRRRAVPLERLENP